MSDSESDSSVSTYSKSKDCFSDENGDNLYVALYFHHHKNVSDAKKTLIF